MQRQTSSLSALQKAVEEVTGPMSKTGCRVILDVKDKAVRVYDLHRWTHEYTELLQYFRPCAEVTIHSSTQSLSGFLIYINEPERPQYIWLRFLCVVVVLCGLMIWWSQITMYDSTSFQFWSKKQLLV